MSFDPEFLDAPLPPELPAGEAHRRFVDELDWHLSEMETLRAELERVRRDADQRLKVELSSLRARHASDMAAELAAQRAALEAALRRSVSAEIEARLSEEFLEKLKVSQEVREKAAESERAYLKERFDAELEQAVAEAQSRIQREADTRLREALESRLDDARAQAEALHAQALAELMQSRDTLAREKDALQARLLQEADAARSALEAASKAAYDSQGRTSAEQRAETQRRVDAAVAELKAAHAKDTAELNKTHQKEAALSATQKDLDAAQARRALEAEHAKSIEEIRRRIQDEAQKELQARTERMKAEWDKLRTRFDEELNKIRAEMKRREQVWEEKVKVAESEGAASAVEMRAKLLNLEDAAARLGREKQALVEECGALRLERDKDSAELAGLKATTDAALKKLSEDKAGLEAKLADTRKELEGKLKTLDTQLREERKKNVEWETRFKELESRGVWQRIRGK